MIIRMIWLTVALLAVEPVAAFAAGDDVIAVPVLRASVTVSDDVVRIGDVIDNAGTAAQTAIYRAPDLGTTGSLPIAQVLGVLQAHQVIGVDTRGIKAVSVTRLSRAIDTREIQSQVAHALEHRGSLGDATNLLLTFDRDLQDIQLDSSYGGEIHATVARYEPRNGRFDVAFEISSDNNSKPVKLRFTGIAIETVDAAVLTRDVQRNEILKSSDVMTERRPKLEIGGDAAVRDLAVGMQLRRQIRAGQALRVADLAKPDLVQRDDNVTLIYESAGLYLTIRGKAMESGTEGDVVSVTNLQSKRIVSGTVIGRGQVAISVATPRLPATGRRLLHRRTGPGRTAFGRLQQRFPRRLESRVTLMSKFGNSRFCIKTSTFKRLALAGTMLSVAGLAGGCSSIDRLSQIGETPKLSAIENPTAQPGYKPVQMPMPKPEAVSYNANSLWRNGSRSFFKDARAHQIGDLLTVTVNITDQANFANETQRSRTNTEDSGITNFLGASLLTGTAAKVLPGRLLTADSTASSDGKGSVQRQESLTTNIAAVVTQLLPNGNMVVEGKQENPRQFRNARIDRRRHRAAGRHPERQHHRLQQDRAGPHRLWRPRPDHRRSTAALRPTGDGRAAAVLTKFRAPTSYRDPRRNETSYAASVSSPDGGRAPF